MALGNYFVASPCPLQRRGLKTLLKKREVKVLSFGEDLDEALGLPHPALSKGEGSNGRREVKSSPLERI
jgi:hypothetical protein